MRKKSLRIRILVPLLVVGTVLLSVFVLSVHWIQQRGVARSFERDLASVRDIYEKELGSDADLMKASLSFIAADERL
ncbi:MAG: hypothetical protein ACE5G2_08885, partial [Candidatus Krumholzibacteriia bacterium]